MVRPSLAVGSRIRNSQGLSQTSYVILCHVKIQDSRGGCPVPPVRSEEGKWLTPGRRPRSPAAGGARGERLCPGESKQVDSHTGPEKVHFSSSRGHGSAGSTYTTASEPLGQPARSPLSLSGPVGSQRFTFVFQFYFLRYSGKVVLISHEMSFLSYPRAKKSHEEYLLTYRNHCNLNCHLRLFLILFRIALLWV